MRWIGGAKVWEIKTLDNWAVGSLRVKQWWFVCLLVSLLLVESGWLGYGDPRVASYQDDSNCISMF